MNCHDNLFGESNNRYHFLNKSDDSISLNIQVIVKPFAILPINPNTSPVIFQHTHIMANSGTLSCIRLLEN